MLCCPSLPFILTSMSLCLSSTLVSDLKEKKKKKHKSLSTFHTKKLQDTFCPRYMAEDGRFTVVNTFKKLCLTVNHPSIKAACLSKQYIRFIQLQTFIHGSCPVELQALSAGHWPDPVEQLGVTCLVGEPVESTRLGRGDHVSFVFPSPTFSQLASNNNL